MAPRRTGTPSVVQGSQPSSEGDLEQDALLDASLPQNTQTEPLGSQQFDENADLEIIATYFVQEKAPDLVREAFARIRRVLEERVTNADTEQAIRVLQEVAQKLDIRPNLDNSSYPTSLGPSYAEVASRFIPSQQPPQSCNL